MPRKPTGNPRGRPPKIGGDAVDKRIKVTGSAQVFDDLSKLHKRAGFDYAVNLIVATGAKMFLGSIQDPTHEAVGSKFGGGSFEIFKRELASKRVIGEPIYLNVHPGVYPIKFGDPYSGPGNPVSTFSGLPQGPQVQAIPQDFSRTISEAVAEAVNKVKDDYEDKLADMEDALEAQEKARLEEKANQREEEHRKEMERLRDSIQNQNNSKGSTDEILRMVELMKALQPPLQPQQNWPQLIGMALPALQGLLSFGKDVALSNKNNPVDVADVALERMWGVLQPLVSKVLASPQMVNALTGMVQPKPQVQVQDPQNQDQQAEPQAEVEQPQQSPEEGAMIAQASNALTARMTEAIDRQEQPEFVAQWFWGQHGIGWMFIHGWVKSHAPSDLVKVVLDQKGKGYVQNQEDTDYLMAVANAILERVPA